MNSWSIRLDKRFLPLIVSGKKDVELRIQTETNAWLIAQMLQYQRGDALHLEFARGKTVVSALDRHVTHQSEERALKDLRDDELARIAGQSGITRRKLLQILRQLYPREEIGEETVGTLAYFSRH